MLFLLSSSLGKISVHVKLTSYPFTYHSLLVTCWLYFPLPTLLYTQTHRHAHTYTCTHTHTDILSCWLPLTSLPLPATLCLACLLSQLHWPLSITPAVSAKLWMSLDTNTTKTPYSTSICTQTISAFGVGWVGAWRKALQSEYAKDDTRHKCPKQHYVCCMCVAVSLWLCKRVDYSAIEAIWIQVLAICIFLKENTILSNAWQI